MSRAAGAELPPALRRELIGRARAEAPLECCGLLLGVRNQVRHIVPMTNVAAGDRRVRFRIDDESHIALAKVIRAFRPALEVIGVYHSHPAGAAIPSASDLDEAYYADWIYVVIGLTPRAAVNAFAIRRGRARQLVLRAP